MTHSLLTRICTYIQAADDVLDVTVNDVHMGLFAVQTEPVKRGIAAKALQMAEVLLSQVGCMCIIDSQHAYMCMHACD
jgi:hypothetical protein